MHKWNRRQFITTTLAAAAGFGLTRSAWGDASSLYKISLIQSSFSQSMKNGEHDPLRFAALARELDIETVEYCSHFFADKAEDSKYLGEMKKVADGEGVRGLRLHCVDIGRLGDPDKAQRMAAVEGHLRWMAAAKELGCTSIRANANSDRELMSDEQESLVVDGLIKVCAAAEEHGLDVLIANEGGLTCDPHWMRNVLIRLEHPRLALLADFDHFTVNEERVLNRYDVVEGMLKMSRGISATAHDFDDKGQETSMDYARLIGIVVGGGYRDEIGINYVGTRLSDADGIRATRELIVNSAKFLMRSQGRG